MTPQTALGLIAGHLGDLHPYETVLVLLLAFGPFVVIVLLVLRERRRHPPAEHETGPTSRPSERP